MSTPTPGPPSSARSMVGSRVVAPPKILVCDDSPTDCAIIRSLLQRRSADVTIVSSAEAALAKLHAESFDLLLLDVQMEGMSGIELTRMIRETSGGYGRIPIILLTGQTGREDRLVGLQAGATDFITKPFDPAELTARIENHVYTKRLYDRLVETNRQLNEERAKVSKVQRDLLPKEMPPVPGHSFASLYVPSSMASGDYFDVIERADGRILLAIGDVSGHGIPSAMHMSVLRAILRSKAGEGAAIHHIMCELNHVLGHALDSFSFVTFYLAEYDATTRRAIQCSAGHHPPMLVNVKDHSIREIPLEASLPLGIEYDLEFPTSEFELRPGDRVALYTDGVTDQTSPKGEFFGLERMQQVLNSAAFRTAGECCLGLEDALQEFNGRRRGESSHQDDATMLLMQVDG